MINLSRITHTGIDFYINMSLYELADWANIIIETLEKEAERNGS